MQARSEGVEVAGLQLVNAAFYHVALVDCTRVRLEGLRIQAPLSSKNTDGITLIGSSQVVVRWCHVDTGDDNCAIKEGTHNVLVEECTFWNGHGSSIGSIGEGSAWGQVHHVVMRNIVFNGTHSAARLKSWQGGRGFISDISYTNLRLIDVRCPLVVDQFYCASSQHKTPCRNRTDAVHISRLLFADVNGTQTSGAAAQLLCADSVPCTDILLQRVHIAASQPSRQLEHLMGQTPPWWRRAKDIPNNTFKCWNALGKQVDVSPQGCIGRNDIGHGLVSQGILSRGKSIGLSALRPV
ncbi:hypothetical protein CYMTET_35538 [Cymbomonas tetramitiformis]|uniref:Polygalacturonase n=1 Tax=Cymbomonas tetramitiformis TaxID=36881 RepID=A0AAE0KNR7_9CHLO|nr:hypothetical protein CYMTET_35538 [Cymbomonas tetramitiformis]